MSIPNLTPVDPWPSRKLPQDRFDASVKTAMDQMSVMVGELNSSFIPAANETAEAIDTLNPDLPAILDAPNQAAAAAASAEAAAESAGAAAESVSAAAQEVEKAKGEVVNAQAEVERAKAEADRAKAEADRAESIAGVGPATVEKLGLVKSDGKTTQTTEDGTLSVPTFGGSDAGLVPAATPEDAKKVLLGDGTWGSVQDDATVMSVSEDLHLTADSPRALVLTATISGLSIYLPDHTTVPCGTAFHIWICPLYSIQLKDSSGQVVKSHPLLLSSSAYIIQLVDETNGLWALAEYKNGSTTDAQGKPGLNIGELAILYSGSRGSTDVRMLSANKAIFCYADSTNSNYGTARVLNISGTSVVAGDPFVFNLHSTSNISIAVLSENKVVVAYRGDVNYAEYSTSVVLSIEENTITSGEPYTFSMYPVMWMYATALSSDRALMYYTYESSSQYYSACALLAVSDMDVSKPSGEIKIDDSSVPYASKALFILSETKALVLYNKSATSTYYAFLTISEDRISMDGHTTHLTNDVSFEERRFALLSSKDKIVVKKTGNTSEVYIITISGTELSCEGPIKIDKYGASSPYIAAISETEFWSFYKSDKNFDRYVGSVCEIKDNSVVITNSFFSEFDEFPAIFSQIPQDNARMLAVWDFSPSVVSAGVLFFA